MDKKIKGLTIEIGGDTTKLGEALEKVNKQGRVLSGELKQIDKLLKLDPENTELLAQKQKVLSEAVANTSGKLETLREAERQVQAQFERGEVSEEQVRALRREIISTQSELDRLGAEAKDSGKELDDAGDRATDFGEKAQKAGAIAVAAIAAVTAICAAAVSALADAAVASSAYADEILTMSVVTGIGTDQLQEYAYAAELVDVSVDTLTGTMAKNIKSMKSACEGSALYVEAYEKLRVAVTDADGQMRDSETVYWEIIGALGKMENETERDALAMQIFGRSAQELNPLIEAGANRMKELGDEAREVGAVLSGETLSELGAFDDSLHRLEGSAGAAKNALGAVLLPELQALSDEGSELLSEFTNRLNDSGGGLDGFIATVDSMTDPIGEAVAGLIGSISDKAVDLVPSLVPVAVSIITSLTDTVVPELLGAVTGMVPLLLDGVQDSLPELIGGLVSLFTALVGAVGDILPPLIDALPGIIMTVMDALLDNLPAIIDGLLTLVTILVHNIEPLISAILPIIPTVISKVLSAVANQLPTILSSLLDLCITLVTQITPRITVEVLKIIPQVLAAVLKGLVEVLVSLGKWFGDLLARFGEWGKNLINKGKQLGADLVRGLWEGIKDLTGWIKDKIAGFADGILDDIKEFFGIHSPSREMAWIGEMLDRGLADGISANAENPLGAIDRLTADMMNQTAELDGFTIEQHVSHRVTAGGADSILVSDLFGKLDSILGAIERGQVLTIDGDTWIGATADGYDRRLGERRELAARGAL